MILLLSPPKTFYKQTNKIKQQQLNSYVENENENEQETTHQKASERERATTTAGQNKKNSTTTCIERRIRIERN